MVLLQLKMEHMNDIDFARVHNGDNNLNGINRISGNEIGNPNINRSVQL